MNITHHPLHPISGDAVCLAFRSPAERYGDQICDGLRCWDRMVFTGTCTHVCHSGALEGRLQQEDIRCFDHKTWAGPLTGAIKTRAPHPPAQHGVQIGYIGKKRFRKEDRVGGVFKASGGKTGLIHLFSALEPGAANTVSHQAARRAK